MTTDTEIRNLEQAKRYFVSMGCSHFHMTREHPQRAKEYKALDIDPTIESEWIREEFETRFNNFQTIPPKDYGWYLRSLESLIERKEFYLEKLFDLTIKIQVLLPLDQIEYVLTTIIGNNGAKGKGGLIQKAYDLKRTDLANKFYNQTKVLLQRAEDSSVQLTSARTYLIDVIEYFDIDESKDFIVRLRDKSYSDQFHYFKVGAEEGNKYSMKMLSECYKEGKGCFLDLDKAKYWDNKSKE